MSSVFKLLFNYQIKSWFNLIITFLIPIIVMIIMIAFNNTVQQPIGSNGVYLTLPGIIISIGPTIGILNFALILNDFKQSLFLKRLKAMPIKTWEFLFSCIIYYLFNIMLISLFFIGVSSAIYYQDINFSWINWIWIFFVIILNSILSCLIGFIINYFINDFKTSLTITLIVFLTTALLSGCYFPLYVIKSSSLLRIISYLIPTTYVSGLMVYSWYYFPPVYNNHNLINYSDYSVFNNLQIPLIVIISLITILIIMILVSSKIKYYFLKSNIRK